MPSARASPVNAGVISVESDSTSGAACGGAGVPSGGALLGGNSAG
jgi:hypothetical protein